MSSRACSADNPHLWLDMMINVKSECFSSYLDSSNDILVQDINILESFLSKVFL